MAKKIKTTDDARKEKLPSGTKVRSTEESVNLAVKKAVEKVNRTEAFKKKSKSVYTADFSEIDEALDEIRKECRKHGLTDYSCNNIYLIIQDALRKIKLAEH
jgi:L-lactate utilization protein LutB